MKRLVLAALLLSTPAYAQAPPPPVPAPPDFQIYGYLDAPAANAVISRSAFEMAGWVLECRSGLQPVSQRVGNVTVNFVSAKDLSVRFVPAAIVPAFSLERPDVARAYEPACHAVGAHVGYWISIPSQNMPPPGDWILQITWITFDGAGRFTPPHTDTRPVTIVP